MVFYKPLHLIHKRIRILNGYYKAVFAIFYKIVCSRICRRNNRKSTSHSFNHRQTKTLS